MYSKTFQSFSANIWIYYITKISNGYTSPDLKIKIVGIVSVIGTINWQFQNNLNNTKRIDGCKIFFGKTGFDYCDIQNQSTFDSNTLTLSITITDTSFNLDPSTVGTSTSTRPSGNIAERNNFYDGTNHRLFYYDDTSIVMAYSSDGTTWHNTQKSVNTTFQSPTANNGSWTNPNNAHALDGVFATDGGVVEHEWKTYGFSIDTQAVIKRIRIRLDAKSNTNTNPDTLTVWLSADGGANRLATSTTVSGLTTTLTTFYSDFTQNTYWIPENITNDKIHIKIKHNKVAGSDTISLDWIALEVDYFANQTIGTLISAAPPTKDQFSLFWDGIYIHTAISAQIQWNGLIYRRGVPNSNGSITWSASQIILAGVITNNYQHITITVDSNKKPMVGYTLVSTPRIIFSTKTDGTWSTATNFPFELNATANNYYISLAPMNNGSIYIVYGIGNSRLLGRLWDTSTVRAIETLSTKTLFDSSGVGEFSTVINSTNAVHVAMMARNGITQDYVHIERVNGVIQAEKTITATVTNQIGPVLSLNSANNTLYCFYGSTSLIIVYKRYKNSWEGSANTLATELATIQTGSLVSAYQTNNTIMGVGWASGAASPFNVRYSFLTISGVSTYSKSLSDTITTTITSLTSFYIGFRSISDTVTWTDNIVKGFLTSLSDSITTSENIVRALILGRGLSDNPTFSDVSNRALALLRDLTDTSTISDLVTRANMFTTSLSDSISTTINISIFADLFRGTSETQVFSDSINNMGNIFVNLVDSISTTLDLNRLQNLFRDITGDIITITDNVTGEFGAGFSQFFRSLSDTIAFADDISRKLILQRLMTDTQVIIDDLQRQLNLFRSMTENIIPSDVLTCTISFDPFDCTKKFIQVALAELLIFNTEFTVVAKLFTEDGASEILVLVILFSITTLFILRRRYKRAIVANS